MSGQDEVTVKNRPLFDGVGYHGSNVVCQCLACGQQVTMSKICWDGYQADEYQIVHMPSLTAAAKRVEELEGEVRQLKDQLLARAWADGLTVDEIYAEEKEEYEQKINSLTAERDRLRAYAECMKCWRDYCHEVHEDKSDWSKTLRRHGWNPSMCGPVEFMDSILTTALSAKGDNCK